MRRSSPVPGSDTTICGFHNPLSGISYPLQYIYKYMSEKRICHYIE